MKGMRILLLYDCLYPDRHGGVEHRNRRLAEQLAGRGHRVTLAGWARESIEEAGLPTGVEVLELPHLEELYGEGGKRRPAASVAYARAAAELPLGRWDVVETANIPYAHLFPVAARARASRVPLLVTWHEYWGSYWREYVGRRKAPVFRSAEWCAAQLGDRVAAVSEFTARRLGRRRLGGRRMRGQAVEVVPNGIPFERLRGIAGEGAEGAAGAGQEAAPVVYAGRLNDNKRVELLVEAVSVLAKEAGRESPFLKIIGEGPESGRLRRLAERRGVAELIEFTGRLEAIEDVWRAVASAELAVQPSAREGFGMFPLEAMALGTPVVHCASPDSAVSEVVRDGREGRQVAADARSLAAGIEALLEDEGRRAEMAEAALERARGFRWSAIAERAEALMASMVRGRS